MPYVRLIQWLAAMLILSAGRDAIAQQPIDKVARVRVAADVETVHPGDTFHLAVIFSLERHWHVYWRNPGATGTPTEITVKGPDGFRIAAPLFPCPKAFTDDLGVSYGYEKEVVIFVPVTAPAELDGKPVSFEVNAFFLVCKGACMLGNMTRRVEVPTAPAGRTGPRPPRAPGADGRVIDAHRSRLPLPLSRLDGASIELADGTLVIRGPGAAPTSFFGEPGPGVTYGQAKMTHSAEGFAVVVPVRIEPNNALGKPMYCAGLLAFGDGIRPGGSVSYEFMHPVPTPSARGTNP